MSTDESPTIHVVDDDASFRGALARLLRIERYNVVLHASAADFLAAAPYGPGCVLLDVNMPGCTGPELQAQIGSRSDVPTIVFLTGRGDIAASVKAIKAGAEDFLTPPVAAADLHGRDGVLEGGEHAVGIPISAHNSVA